MIRLIHNTLYFPEKVNFHHISYLYNILATMMEYDEIVFDLSETRETHAAFVGFLIYLKTEKEKYNGTISLKLSHKIEQILDSLQLCDFFHESKRSA